MLGDRIRALSSNDGGSRTTNGNVPRTNAEFGVLIEAFIFATTLIPPLYPPLIWLDASDQELDRSDATLNTKTFC